MGLNTRPWSEKLAQLLPPGAAMAFDRDGNLAKLIAALADELDRVQLRIISIRDEADPRTTVELLPEWEEQYGLPEACGTAPTSYPERIDALVEKVTRIGGASPAYFIGRAAAIGFTVTITEYDAWTATSAPGAPQHDENWRFRWDVNAPSETVTYWEPTGGPGEPIATWGNEPLECLISRLAPAHTIVRFTYGA